MAEIKSLVAYFKKELNGHMKDEEKTLFPFISSHIPRLQPMVYLLLSEHEDFKENLQSLEKLIRGFQQKKILSQTAMDLISEKGTYLLCLLRSHMSVESCSLYRAADKELRLSEKRLLIRQIKEREARKK
jgi:hemerythrin-like domain-containing protein